MKELEIPPAAKNDPKSVEVLRLWVAGGAEWVSLNQRIYRNRDFKEEWAWGVFLSDTIKHLANAIHDFSAKIDRKSSMKFEAASKRRCEIPPPMFAAEFSEKLATSN